VTCAARRALLLWFPCAVLLSAYVVICVRFHSAWPWELVVHEDGRHTLLGTVFYFEHALGELPLEWLLAASVAGAVGYCRGVSLQFPIGRFAATAVALDALIFAGACWSVGLRGSLLWLFEYRTREGEPLEFGSHWRYHLLSEAALMLLAVALTGWAAGGATAKPRPAVWWMSWAAFGVLTTLFGWSTEPFRDARYLGHQARETLTHALVTIPLAVAVCLRISGQPAPDPAKPRGAWWAAVGFSSLAAYQFAGAVVTGSQGRAQSNDLVSLICVHFFEHVFSYAVVAAHAVLLYAVVSRR